MAADFSVMDLRVNGTSLRRSSRSGRPLTFEVGTYVTISVTIRNEGDAAGSGELEVTFDGRVIISRRIDELGPGRTIDARAGVGRPPAGHYEINGVVRTRVKQGGGADDGVAEPPSPSRPVAAPPASARIAFTDLQAAAAPRLHTLDAALIKAVLDALGRAVPARTPFRQLMEAIVGVAPGSFRWPATLAWSLGPGLKAIGEALRAARVESDSDLRAALEELLTRLEPRDGRASRPAVDNLTLRMPASRPAGELELAQDAATSAWWSWWDPDALRGGAGTEGIGRIVAVRVDEPSIGEQANLFLHVVEDPSIDFGRILQNPAAAAALAAMAGDPDDARLRALAVAAIAIDRPRSTTDLTAGYTSVGSLARSPSAVPLDGTIAITRSRAVQVGDRLRQENEIVAVLSPTLDAATLLAGDADLVNKLLDVIASGAGTAEMAAFEATLGRDLTISLAAAPTLRDRRGVVAKPPGAGSTLRIERAAEVMVGGATRQIDRARQDVDLGSLPRRIEREARDAGKRTERTAKELLADAAPPVSAEPSAEASVAETTVARPQLEASSHVLVAHIRDEPVREVILMALEELEFVSAGEVPEARSDPSGDRPRRTYTSFRSGVVPDRQSLLLAVIGSEPTVADRDHWAEIVEAAWGESVEVLSITVGGAQVPRALRQWPAVDIDANTRPRQLAALLQEHLTQAQADARLPAQESRDSTPELGARIALIAEAADFLAAERLQ